MKNQKTSAAVAFAAVTPALLEQVEGVLAYAAKNKYQASAVYAAHNQVFGLKETPEVCASCNIKRVGNLRRWLADYRMSQVDSTNAAANAKGQGDVSRETMGDLEGIMRVYGAPNFDDEEERDQWLNGLLTQNGLALNGFRQLDEEELAIINAALQVEDMADIDTGPRDAYTDVLDIYAAYLDMEDPGDEAVEREFIQGLMEQDAAATGEGLSMLFDSERKLLNDRLGELVTTIDTSKMRGADQPSGANNTEIIDDQDTAGVLNLKNKKGETFTGTFNSEDGVNGTLVDDKGVSFKPGTYSTETGDSYAVQPGGKATYKNDAI